eukprot:4110937-Amphidinium_carterae.1
MISVNALAQALQDAAQVVEEDLTSLSPRDPRGNRYRREVRFQPAVVCFGEWVADTWNGTILR